MTLRHAVTAVVERNTRWEGEVATEPWEVGWASEAIFFVRILDQDAPKTATLRIQVSPDGMEWVDEGPCLSHDGESLLWARVSHFGGWLRLAGSIPPGQHLQVIVYLSLKE